MSTTSHLVFSDYAVYGRDSGQYTYVSDAHCTTSWLDHMVCSQDIRSKLKMIDILDKLPSSNHLPLSVIIDVQVHSVPSVSSVYSSPRDQLVYNWTKADITEVNDYCMQTYHNFFKISILFVIKCTNVNCKFIKYRHEIDLYDSEICKALHCSILDSIPSSKSSEGRDYMTKFTFLRLRRFCTLKCLKSHLFNTNIFLFFKFEICAYTLLKTTEKLN